MLRLDHKIALVTGMGSVGPGWGNGKAISVLFARQGASVFGLDRDPAAGERTATLIREDGGTVESRACDVTDADSVKAAVEACVARFGRIDILVNNVGRSERGGPAELDESAWQEQIETNLGGAYRCCHQVLPLMERQGSGAIVNISSVAGMRYIGKDQVGYSTAKAGLMQLTRTTAVIYAARGVRLNCVVPGLIDTPLVHRLADKYADDELDQFVALRNKQVPMGHMGDAWDVAHAALYLASEEARYVTGHSLVVDGGLTCSTP